MIKLSQNAQELHSGSFLEMRMCTRPTKTDTSRLETEAFVNCMVRGEAETLKSEAIEYSENIRLVIFSLTIIIWRTQTKKLRKRLILYTEPNDPDHV